MILRLAWKNIWRNRRRTLITIMAIAFAVMSAVALRSLKAGMNDQLLKSVVEDNIGHLQIQSVDFWDDQTLDNGFYAEDLPMDRIKTVDNIKEINKKLEAGTLSSTGTNSRGTFIISLDQTNGIPDKITNNIISGHFPEEGHQQILLGEGLAKYLETGMGDTVIFMGPGYHGAMAAGLFTLSGIIDLHIPELNQMVAYMSISDLQKHISAPGLITALMINLDKPDKVESSRDKIQNIVGNDYAVKTWYEINPEIKQMMDANDGEGVIFYFLLYMIITFVLFGTVLMATQERKYELGVLIAIGMKKQKTMAMLFLEHIFTTLIGAIIGVLLVAPLAYYFHYNPIHLGGEGAEIFKGFGFDPVIPFSVDPQIAIDHGGIVMVIAIILSFYPLYIINKLKPVEAMKM